ncbi:MAG: hypothetical protein ACOX6V_01260 [Patescibacteria group bacterium]|jgi:hypothetical protein
MKVATIKKTIITFFLLYWSAFSIVPVRALEAPSSPSAPSAPASPSSETSDPNDSSESTDTPSAPETPSAPSLNESNEEDTAEEESQSPAPSPTPEPAQAETQSNTSNSSTDSQGSSTNSTADNVVNDGNTGETVIKTGDVTTTGTAATIANTNTNTQSGTSALNGDIVVITEDNGSGSINNTDYEVIDDSQTLQDNNAAVGNNLNLDSVSGHNSASKNLGDSMIISGDANVSGTAVTAVNTNVDGVGLAHFTIADDHKGDIILDFSSLVPQEGTGSAVTTTSGNGSNSENDSSLTFLSDSDTFQTNDAAVGNNLTLVADSGLNTASYNTGGDSIIKTGDANVSANAITFANNNFSGNVIYAVVDIFGSLEGDIILPLEAFNAFLSATSSASLAAATTGNGSNSTNTTEFADTETSTLVQDNNAEIANDITAEATTGDNQTSNNTGGNSIVKTGNADTDVNVLNIANNNLEGGNWWLVLVNKAGQWIGKIFGMKDGAVAAGSEGLEVTVNEDGSVNATNGSQPATVTTTENGANSKNVTTITQTENSETFQTNNAAINNSLNLTANTGGNTASYNTGGDSTIITGDAKIVANIVNFVNNNIATGGKLIVTVINVFDKWFGDFLPPGVTKPTEEDPGGSNDPGTGGGGVNPTQENTNNNSTSVSEDSSQESSSTQSTENTTSTTGKVLSYFKSNRNQQVVEQTNDNQDSKVLGEYFSNTNSKQKVDVNLAWLLLGIPGLGVALLIKRRRKIANWIRFNLF